MGGCHVRTPKAPNQIVSMCCKWPSKHCVFTNSLSRKYLRRRVRQHVISPKLYISFQKVRIQNLACFCALTSFANGFSGHAFGSTYYRKKNVLLRMVFVLLVLKVSRTHELFRKCMRRRFRQHIVFPKMYISLQKVPF